MKRLLNVLSIITALTAAAGSAVFAQSAQQIIGRADSAFSGEQVYTESSMTIYRSGRTQPVQKIKSYSMDIDGGYNSLTVYQSPARMKGTAYLMIDNDLWVRFSTTGRVRKMSSSAKTNSAGGSDLSYADMGDGNQGIADKYNVGIEGEAEIDGSSCYVILLEPKDGEDPPYEKLAAYISKEDYLYLKIDYFEAGAVIKTMTLGDYRKIDDIYYPFYMEMKSNVKDSLTVIETTAIEFGSSKVQKRLFSTAYLESLR